MSYPGAPELHVLGRDYTLTEARLLRDRLSEALDHYCDQVALRRERDRFLEGKPNNFLFVFENAS